MMRRFSGWPTIALVLASAATLATGAEKPSVRIVVKNPLAQARASETVEVGLAMLGPAFKGDDLPRIHVTDAGTGHEILSQDVDRDGDGTPDLLVFQADFSAKQERTFSLAVGEKRLYKREDFHVYGRFVRERFDDFAWENDRIAHRMYGAALETWEKEPLTSSTVDVWTKRTRKLVVNDWYMMDDYHHDSGEGADFYSAGKSRGCGGNGIWRDGRLYSSRNFRGTRVLANGPIRLIFELLYEPWDAGGVKVSERKRVTLDAGQNMDHFESFYTIEGGGALQSAPGIRKQAGLVMRAEKELGWLRGWEPVKTDGSNLGQAIVLETGALPEVVEGDGNYLLPMRVDPSGRAAYYAGFGWDKSGDFTTVAEWDRYIEDFTRRLRVPLVVSVAP